jgi:hypothetical protein
MIGGLGNRERYCGERRVFKLLHSFLVFLYVQNPGACILTKITDAISLIICGICNPKKPIWFIWFSVERFRV